MFTLHARLQADTVPVLGLELCDVLLMQDAAFPWLILVPRRPEIREIHQLDAADRGRLIEEIARAARVLEHLYGPEKINVGALGNVVAQLHVHVIARFTTDRAWPGPVWGSGPARPYAPAELDVTRERLRQGFADLP
ncbi:MAG: HIT family protein [Pseudomonadota bacterium]|nr:HIT family protein [Pseudomonadota bacterium]